MYIRNGSIQLWLQKQLQWYEEYRKSDQMVYTGRSPRAIIACFRVGFLIDLLYHLPKFYLTIDYYETVLKFKS